MVSSELSICNRLILSRGGDILSAKTHGKNTAFQVPNENSPGPILDLTITVIPVPQLAGGTPKYRRPGIAVPESAKDISPKNERSPVSLLQPVSRAFKKR